MARTTRRTGMAKRLGTVQAQAERVISRGYETTLGMLPPGPRQAVKDLAKQLEATADELSKRRAQTVKAVVKRSKALNERVASAARSMERRRNRVLTTAEKRGTALLSTVERRVAEVLRPIARRLELATVRDLEQLTRRLAQLERKLNGSRRRAA